MKRKTKVKHLNRNTVAIRMPTNYAIALRYMMGMLTPDHLEELCRDQEMQQEVEALFSDLMNSEIDIRDPV